MSRRRHERTDDARGPVDPMAGVVLGAELEAGEAREEGLRILARLIARGLLAERVASAKAAVHTMVPAGGGDGRTA